jgi:recombination protein RecR
MVEELDKLVEALSKLPGIGRRSAERIAFRLVSRQSGLVDELIAALKHAGARVKTCSRCGVVTTTDRDPCRFCTDPARDQTALYVVEDPSDVYAIERAGGIRGRYHVLMGKISPMSGEGPSDLRLESLLERIDQESCTEVILALNTDVESDATASFIRELLKDRDVKVTRLALGLPVGSGIAYSDPVTLGRAISGRQDV